MEWLEFALAMVLFMGSHRIPAATGAKEWLVRNIGSRGYLIAFNLFSIVLLLWVIYAAARAPYVHLWDSGVAARWAVNLLMPVVTALAVFGIAAPNPFAFEGRDSGFDPLRPGIAGLTRQPLLWALFLWSAVHIWANGALAHVILFGTFALFSLLGLMALDKRKRRQIGDAAWSDVTAHTSLIPFAALIDGRWRPKGPPPLVRSALALISWALVWHLHEPVIGASPLP